jgi:hypothetical protein
MVNTFLPYPDFNRTARCLDYKRLGKQRVEVFQILQALLGIKKGWRHHPATKMWKGYEWCLFDYNCSICLEWRSRGYQDTIYDKMDLLPFPNQGCLKRSFPPWLGDERLHQSHRSNLLRKNKEYYGKFGWMEPDNLPYYWPV